MISLSEWFCGQWQVFAEDLASVLLGLLAQLPRALLLVTTNYLHPYTQQVYIHPP